MSQIMRCAKMYMQGTPGSYCRNIGQQLQLHVDIACGHKAEGVGYPVATLNAVFIDTAQIQCAALTGPPFLRLLVLSMNAAHAQLMSGRHQAQIQRSEERRGGKEGVIT